MLLALFLNCEQYISSEQNCNINCDMLNIKPVHMCANGQRKYDNAW